MGFQQYNYRLHLRSLFISKFFYQKHDDIAAIRALRLSFVGAVAGFNVLFLIFLTIWGTLPRVSRVTLRLRGGSLRTLIIIYADISDQKLIFTQISKLTAIYLPALEPIALFPGFYRGFTTKNHTWFRFFNLFYVFFELDFIFNYAFTLLKVFTQG